MASEQEWRQLMVEKFFQEEEEKDANHYQYQTDKKLNKFHQYIYLYLKSPDKYMTGDFLIFLGGRFEKRISD
jgi:hypothetical protein